MLTKDDLEQIGKLLEPLKKQLDTVEMKVEASHQFNKKAHSQITNMLVESNDVNGEEIRKLKERIEKIEETLNISQN